VDTISRLGEAEAERRLTEKGKRLYELAFAPLREALGEAKTLYLAPDGELNLIPFGVLADEEDRYLVPGRKG
jgi:CHAT domain-containing protein